ncbi:LysR family transcriptional regulator [Rheinheimera sp.]|uniref:LysR family transcriptional regulator n=1 Tax=Rheinheimera sp. TaxID=1869214 RepID=UPI002FDE039E
MPDLNDLYLFAKVAQAGGFAAASRQLQLPKSTLSRRIARLEQQLAVRLIQRSTRHFVLTELGQIYLEHCKAMLVEAEAAQQAIDRLTHEPKGIIRLSCPVGLLHFHLGQMLADFMLLYPGVQIHLEATNRRVDVLAEGFDLAVRVRPAPLEDSDLVLRILSDRGQCLVASPSLVQQQGLPQQPEQLASWPALSRTRVNEPQQWCLHHADGQIKKVDYQPRLITTDMATLLSAALAGVGVVQLPQLMVGPYLASGQLSQLLPDWTPRREMIHLVFPSRRGLLPSVRSLIDYLVQRYEKMHED